MKVYVLVVVFAVALSQGNVLPAGPAVSNQNSNVRTGDGGTGISHGISTADGGIGGANANQKSTAVGSAGSTVVADGEAHATSQGGPYGGGAGVGAAQYLNKYGLGGGGGSHGRHGGGHGGGVGPGFGLGPGAAVANQQSKVRTGPGGTGISSGKSTAQGGLGGALSNQQSTSIGEEDSTVVADGSSSASTIRKRSVPDAVYVQPGGVRVDKSLHNKVQQGPAVANQESTVKGGHGGGITGIAHGTAEALGGAGGALSNQKSVVTGEGANNVLVADGSSYAATVRREVRHVYPHGGAPAFADQTSIAQAGHFSSADASGKAKANSAGGLASASQQSIATAGNGSHAKATGSAEANSFPVYKRAVDPPAVDLESPTDLITAAINKTATDAANKIVADPNVLVAESKVAAVSKVNRAADRLEICHEIIASFGNKSQSSSMSLEKKVQSFGGTCDKVEFGDKAPFLPPEHGLQVDLENLLYDSFPPGFRFGVGSSAAQIEGGWNADGKGPSVWDTLCIQKPEAIEDGTSSFVTCDAYNNTAGDVQLLKDLKCTSYKFSLSWSRILPHGDLSVINQKGIDYYNDLIDSLLANGIEPLVVMWHFDLPTALGTQFSWKDEHLIPHFVNYARLCFRSFGDRVKRWMTINEPWIYAVAAHDLALYPPNLQEPEYIYNVLHNLLLAHSRTYRMYDQEFREKQGGKVGICLNCFGREPASDSAADEESAQIAYEFEFGILAHPLFFGEYPPSVQKRVDEKSRREGREKSRLPLISAEEGELFKGAVDFIGLNHYSCQAVASTKEQIPEGVTHVNYSSSDTIGVYNDSGTFNYYDPQWLGSGTWWIKFRPQALRPILNRIKMIYGNPEILVTENGYPDKVERMEDNDRSHFFQGYLNETLKAIKLDGCNVTGFYAWGFLDGWEWNTGHAITFGIFHVDRTDPKKKRTPRLSAGTLKTIFANKGFIKN